MKNIIAAILGTALFLLMPKVFILGNIFIRLLLALVVFIMTRRIISKITQKKDPSESMNQLQKDNQALLREGIRKLTLVRQKTRMIKDNAVAQKVQDICKIGMEIFDDLKKHPEDIKKAKQFINYYLDTTEKIVNQYVELSNKRTITAEIEESLKKVEEILDSVKDTFNKQLQSLLDDDLLNLDTEIKVLKNTMKMEG